MIKKITSISVQIISLKFLIAALLIITGCNTFTSEGLLERNKQFVLNMNHELWNNGNLDKMNEFFSPNIIRHFLPDNSEVKGIDRLREEETKLRNAFPDWQEDIKHIVAEGDLVVIHFVSSGTNKGSWLGNPPSGRSIQINEMSIFRIANGKIAEQWLLPDIYGMKQQLAGNGNK